MHRAISLTSRLGALLSLVACADTRRSSALATPGAQEFQHRVANRGSITFRTWNGKLVGRDADAELTFFRDGSAHLFDWGISGERFWGTYHVHPDGSLAIWFEDHRNEWPVMIVHRDGDGALRLRPLNPPIGYREGKPGPRSATRIGTAIGTSAS